MNVLITRHAESTRLGTVGSFLAAAGASVRVMDLHRGERFPAALDGLDALVVMGGRMHAFDDAEHPFLAEEAAFMRRAADAGLPILGICLGAQLLARALGERVERGGAPEEGWIEVGLTEAGRCDPLFDGLPDRFVVCANHGDRLEVPRDAKLLAGSSGCPQQAIRYRNAFGLQFHIEVDEPVLEGWVKWKPHWAEFAGQFGQLREGIVERAHRIYSNFLKLTGKPAAFGRVQ